MNDVDFNFLYQRQISIIDRNKSDIDTNNQCVFVTCENKYSNILLHKHSNSCAGTDMVFLEMAERKKLA